MHTKNYPIKRLPNCASVSLGVKGFQLDQSLDSMKVPSYRSKKRTAIDARNQSYTNNKDGLTHEHSNSNVTLC